MPYWAEFRSKVGVVENVRALHAQQVISLKMANFASSGPVAKYEKIQGLHGADLKIGRYVEYLTHVSSE
jgi:hypothetical protein